MERGYDFKFGYSAAYIPPCDFYSGEDQIINEQCNLFSERLKSDSTKFIATPSCFSDPTPRFSQRWLDLGYDFRKSSKIWYLSPEKYKELHKEEFEPKVKAAEAVVNSLLVSSERKYVTLKQTAGKQEINYITCKEANELDDGPTVYVKGSVTKIENTLDVPLVEAPVAETPAE